MSSTTRENVAIFWDYENCQPASTGSGYSLVHNLRRLACHYGDVTLFKAYLEATPTATPRPLTLRSELQSSGVSLTDCPHNGRKDVADKMMLVDMLAFAIDNPTPSTVILVSGDRDFAYAVSVLRLRRYRVVIIAPPTIHMSLKAQASALFDWNRDILCRAEASPLVHPAIPPAASNRDVHPDKSPSHGKNVVVPTPIAIESTLRPSQLDSVSTLSSNFMGVKAGMGLHGGSDFSPAPQQSPSRPAARSMPLQEASRPSTTSSYFTAESLPHEGNRTSDMERVDSRPFPNPSQSMPHFKLLIDLLVERGDDGDLFPSWSSIAECLEHHGIPLYEQAGVETFDEYAALAVMANVGIIVGEMDGREWISLHPAFFASLATAGPSSCAPSSSRMGAEEDILTADDTGSLPAEFSPSPRFANSERCIENPAVPSQVHVPSAGSPPNEDFDTLRKELLRQCTMGITHPLRTNLGAELTKQDSQIYARAGVTRFRNYVALAEQAGVISTGGDAHEAWISLCALAPFHPLVDVLHQMRQEGDQMPLRSPVSVALLKKNPILYQDVGFKGFKKYISAAEGVGLVEVGGSDGDAWISLRSY